ADSIRRQKVKTGGDMATVFRSREHGDPCTPLLEAYEGERVMVRLIQGAQEVQHVFTVEGKSFRRNVDQPFSYNSRLGADDMKHNGPTRWNACMKMAESGSPSEHSKLFGTDQLDDLKPGFLDDYRKMTSYCDNATGMISGQEIGISEHFEVAAKFSATSNVGSESFRQKVAGAKMMAAPAEGGKLIGGIEAALPVRDSLYHFGTVDALWNGSWGMLRIFANKDSTDVTKCLAADGRTFPTSSLEDCIGTKESLVGMRLIPVPNEDEAGAEVRAAMTLSAEKKVPSGSLSKAEVDRSLTGDFPDGPDLSCPFIEAKAFEDILDPAAIADMANAATHKAPNLVRALVAIEARKLGISAKDNPFGGVPYDAARGLHDPDGLMLVPVPLASLGLSEQKVHAMTRRGADSEGSFAAVDWIKAQAAAKAVVEARGYIPYVQRIRAGDCLRLVVVNGLTETKVSGAPVGDMTGNARRGLRDRPGDALLPKITRLNTDLTVDKDSERQDYTMGELTASASLALTIPMSMITHADDVAEPVGVNPRPALAPAVETGQAQLSVMTYFAGTVGFEGAGLDKVLATRKTAQASSDAAYGIGLQCADPDLRTNLTVWPEVNEVCGSGDDDFTVPVLGRRYCVRFADPAARKDRLTKIEDCFRQTLQTFHYGRELLPGERPISNAENTGDPIRLRIVPHAFGALPVKSLSDPIGHAAHGLAGMVIVEPMEAQFECAAGDDKCANAGVETALTAIIKTPEIIYSAGVSQVIAKAQITEHAMLWQDGLNLWDGLRKPMYSISGGGCVLSSSNPNCSGPSKKIGGPVPDCDICDDSYDHGEKAANYASNALFARLRGKTVASDDLPLVGEPSVELPQCLGLAEYESPAG
ncbi:MAG: hypothetical protein WCC66_13835, partial [Rhizobiaceae bacterium]